MLKRRQIDIDLVGIDSSGFQRVVDTYQCDVFDPAGTATDEIFRATNIPSPGERAMRGTPGLGSNAGDSDQFSPQGVHTAEAPVGNSPTED